MLQDIPAPHNPLPLRLLDWPLPAYRYVPGLHPHPFRMEGGHMFDAGAAPEHPEWVPVSDWQQDRVWLRGLDLFDQRFYWECHESFEAMWHALERGSLLHRLTQGLIQSAASVLKRHMGHEKSADYLMVRATEKLLSVAEESASFCRGVELLDFVAQMERFKEGGEWPQIGREV